MQKNSQNVHVHKRLKTSQKQIEVTLPGALKITFMHPILTTNSICAQKS